MYRDSRSLSLSLSARQSVKVLQYAEHKLLMQYNMQGCKKKR